MGARADGLATACYATTGGTIPALRKLLPPEVAAQKMYPLSLLRQSRIEIKFQY